MATGRSLVANGDLERDLVNLDVTPDWMYLAVVHKRKPRACTDVLVRVVKTATSGNTRMWDAAKGERLARAVSRVIYAPAIIPRSLQ